MHRYTDRAGLIGNGTCDRLPDPPCRVGAELKALGIIILLDCLDKPQIALLDQIKELHPAAHIPLGNAHHQAQVRLRQAFPGRLVPCLHASRQLNLLLL